MLQVGQGLRAYLGDDVFVLFIFEDGFWREVKGQHHKPDDIRLNLRCLLKA